MDILDLLDTLDKKEKSLVLYSLLDRIPIIIFGDSSESVDQFVIELAELIDFRKDLVFDTDFVSYSEFKTLIENESNDYNTMRVIVRCATNVAMKSLNLFDNFQSMIIGFHTIEEDEIRSIRKIVDNKEKLFLMICVKSNQIQVNLHNCKDDPINIDLEQKIFKKISENTEISIEKMKRVLSERITKEGNNGDLKNILLDLDIEKREIKKNIFHKEIRNFYAGSKRAFFVLSKLNLLTQMQIGSKIGSKTLLETIDYQEAPIERVLSFIKKEWGQDFSNLVENNKLAFIGDKIQSFWG